MRFEPDRQHTLTQWIDGGRHDSVRTRIQTTHWYSSEYKEVVSVVTINIGPVGIQVNITPAEARAISKMFAAHADAVDAHQNQLDEQKQLDEVPA